MSTAAQLPEIDSLQVEAPSARSPRGVFVGFATMVTIGLALGGWYVGERILATEAQASTSSQPAVQLTAPTQPASAGVPEPAQPAETQAVAPPAPPQYFLQVAALGTAQDEKFLKRLQNKGLTAQLETNPADQTGLILIGPFNDERELKHAGRRLAAAGILAIETIR